MQAYVYVTVGCRSVCLPVPSITAVFRPTAQQRAGSVSAVIRGGSMHMLVFLTGKLNEASPVLGSGTCDTWLQLLRYSDTVLNFMLVSKKKMLWNADDAERFRVSPVVRNGALRSRSGITI